MFAIDDPADAPVQTGVVLGCHIRDAGQSHLTRCRPKDARVADDDFRRCVILSDFQIAPGECGDGGCETIHRCGCRHVPAAHAHRVRDLLAQRDIKIELTQAAKDYIVDKGADTDFGARPLKRAIQHELQDPLALQILEGNFRDGDTVNVDADGEKLVFSK